MIQVLKRATHILEVLRSRRGLGLQELQAETGLKKTTLSNILKTLCDLGFLQRDNGRYELGSKLLDLAQPLFEQQTLVSLASGFAEELAHRTQEAAVVTVLRGDDIFPVARVVYKRGVTVNTDLVTGYSPYSTATGRVILAYMDPETRAVFIEKRGLPQDEWNGVRTLKQIEQACENIRKRGIEIKEAAESEVSALGVPVIDDQERFWAALGVFLPAARYTGEHKEKMIREINAVSRKASQMLSAPDIT